MSKIGTLKYSNYEYAPGLTTYGIDGRNGTAGRPGTTLFVSVYKINVEDDVEEFGKAILYSYSTIDRSNNKLTRDYINGDAFLFSDGSIWRIDDIDNIKNAVATGQISGFESLSVYMTQVGTVESESEDGFTESGAFMILDTHNYKGFVIDTTGDAGEYIQETNSSPFSIVSNDIGNDNIVRFVSLKSVFAGKSATSFNIYYDNDNNAWIINSDKPVLMDCDVKLKESSVEDFDEYSKPLMNEEPITDYYSNCRKLICSVSGVTNPTDVVSNVEDNTPDDGTINPSKKMNEFAIEYRHGDNEESCDKIEYQSSGIMKNYETLKFYVGKETFDENDEQIYKKINIVDTESSEFKLINDFKFRYEFYYHQKVMKLGELRDKKSEEDNDTTLYFYYDRNGVERNEEENKFDYLTFDIKKLVNNVTVDDDCMLRVIWSKRVVDDKYVDVNIDIPFVENKQIVSEVEFTLKSEDENFDWNFLLGSWIHICRFDSGSNLVADEFYTRIDDNIKNTRSFKLRVDKDISKSSVWKVSVLDAVEINLQVESESKI